MLFGWKSCSCGYEEETVIIDQGIQAPVQLLIKCFFLWCWSLHSSFSPCWSGLALTTDVITSGWFSELPLSTHYSFHKYMLSFYYVLDTGGSMVNRINHSCCLYETYNLVNGTDQIVK